MRKRKRNSASRAARPRPANSGAAVRIAPALLLSGTLCAGGIAVGAQIRLPAVSATEGQSATSLDQQAQGRLASTFGGFAGSEANAHSLVAGLRQGSEITLIAPARPGQPGMTARFTPPTRPMSYGDVRVSLGLAREQLAQLGIAEPTPSQLKAVLAGGAVVSRANSGAPIPFLLPGVLPMRADGMGWNRIATNMGVKLGQAMGGKPGHNAPIPPSPLLSDSVAARPAASVAAAAKTSAPARRRSESVSPLVPVAASTMAGGATGAKTTPIARETAPRANLTAKESASKTPAVARETAALQRPAQAGPEPHTAVSAPVVETVAESTAQEGRGTTPVQGESNRAVVSAGAAPEIPAIAGDGVRREESQAAD